MDVKDRDRERLIQSTLFSIGFWIIIFLIFIFLPQMKPNKPAPVFTSVRLTLQQKDMPVPVSQSASPFRRKTAPSQTSTVQKAPAGLGIPNFSKPVSSSNENSGNAEYLDFSSSNETLRPKAESSIQSGSPVAEFEGTAAEVQKNTDTAVSVSGKKSGAKSSTTRSAVSAETSRSLSNVSSGSSGSDTSVVQPLSASGSVPASSSSTVGGVSFDGIARKLLFPSDPAIVLPAHLARLVDSDRTVTVQFTVRPDGTVPLGSVSFIPSAALPGEVRDYLKNEFSRWRFEKNDNDGQANFLYSIRMK